MQIKKVEFLGEYYPGGSGGTGYDVPAYFSFVDQDNIQHKVCIPLWYRPAGAYPDQFNSGVAWAGLDIENKQAAYEMFCHAYLMDSQVHREDMLAKAIDAWEKQNG